MKKTLALLLFPLSALAASATSTIVGSKVGTNVYCIGGCSGGVGGGGSSFSLVDKSAFSFGTDSFVPGGGVYQDSSPGLTAGTSGAFRLTQFRGLHVNLRDASGVEFDPRLIRALTAADVVTAQQGGAPWTVSGSGTFSSRLTDGTNSLTKLFDNDTGAGTEFNIGVSLRKSAPGGSVELGTASDPMRTDPTGSTVQPVSVPGALPLPTGASTEATLALIKTDVDKIPASPATAGNQTSELTKLDLLHADRFAATPTLSQATITTSNNTFLASNSSRKKCLIYNDGSSIAYVAFGSTATTTAYSFQMKPLAYFECGIPTYTGAISAVTASGATTLQVTEVQ